LKRSKTSFIFSSPSTKMHRSDHNACYMIRVKMRARWQLAGVSTNVSRDGPRIGIGCTPTLVLFFEPVFDFSA